MTKRKPLGAIFALVLIMQVLGSANALAQPADPPAPPEVTESPDAPGEQLPGATPAPSPEQLPAPNSEIIVRNLPTVQVTDPAEIQRIGDSAIQESAQQQRSPTPIQGCTNTRFKSCGVYIAPIQQYKREGNLTVPLGTLNVNITLVMTSSVNSSQSNIFAYFESEVATGTPVLTGTFTFTPAKVGPDGIQTPVALMRTFNLNPPGVISYEQYPEFSKLTTSSIGWSTYTFTWTAVIAGTIQEGPPPGTFYTEQRIRCDSTAAFGATGCVNPTNYPTVYYNKAVIPTITQHVLDRQAITGEGRPFGSSLTRTNKDGIDLNRDISCPASQLRRLELLGEKPGPDEMENPSCDEYPLASSDQGGSGASVRWVPLKENNSQGGTMSQFYKGNRVMVGDNFYVNAFN